MKREDLEYRLGEIITATRGPMNAFGDLKAKRQLTRAINAIRENVPRASPKSIAPKKSDPVTPAKRKAVMKDRKRNPTAPLQEIAERNKVNAGRVSNIVNKTKR